jgi:hypothetical protein
MADSADSIPTVRIRNGSLYLSLELYRTYFSGLESVILLRQPEKILIMPVMHSGGGGILIKIRNARGDRVVHAQEFFREHGLDESIDQVLDARWNSETAALEIELPGDAEAR